MYNIKEELKKVITETMIPESEAFLEELHELLENKTATEDDMEAIKDMESFLVELQNILLAIENDTIDDEEGQEIFEKIQAMLDEHEEHKDGED
jgi:CO dehydrogenase/acetyl-CoA synthase beta subunit